jgi:phosphatidyl-myo-inositol dimannoside synthase
MVCLALSEVGVPLEVIVLNDKSTAAIDAMTAFPGVQYTACSGSRRAFINAARRASRHRPSIIIVGHPHFTPLGWIMARLYGSRVVVFMYGIEVWEPLTLPRRWTLQRSDQRIAISRFTANRAARANHLALGSIQLLYNCLDPGLEARVPAGEAERALSMLTVSRITSSDPYKGHTYVLAAMPALLERFPELVYHIVGDGDARPSLEALVAQYGLERSVRFHGIVDDEQLACLYSAASLFIMPSTSEGFGFVFVEAMNHGTPVIGGNSDASPEVIDDGVTGYVVDPTSIPSIVHAASSLLIDPDLRCRMGEAARERVRAQFSFETFRRQLLSHLDLQVA